jgi:hypothetical protein
MSPLVPRPDPLEKRGSARNPQIAVANTKIVRQRQCHSDRHLNQGTKVSLFPDQLNQAMLQ